MPPGPIVGLAAAPGAAGFTAPAVDVGPVNPKPVPIAFPPGIVAPLVPGNFGAAGVGCPPTVEPVLSLNACLSAGLAIVDGSCLGGGDIALSVPPLSAGAAGVGAGFSLSSFMSLGPRPSISGTFGPVDGSVIGVLNLATKSDVPGIPRYGCEGCNSGPGRLRVDAAGLGPESSKLGVGAVLYGCGAAADDPPSPVGLSDCFVPTGQSPSASSVTASCFIPASFIISPSDSSGAPLYGSLGPVGLYGLLVSCDGADGADGFGGSGLGSGVLGGSGALELPKPGVLIISPISSSSTPASFATSKLLNTGIAGPAFGIIADVTCF